MNENLPLQDKTIVVTRPRAQAKTFAGRLEELGAKVIAFPTIELQPLEAPLPIESTEGYDWVVFTSANSARFLAEGFRPLGLDMRFPGAKVCAVGTATAGVLAEYGVETDVVPQQFIAEGALDAILEVDSDVEGKRFLLPRGDIAREVLAEELTARGARVTELVVYRTVKPAYTQEDADALVAARPDIVTFTSASTARHYVEMLGPDRIAALEGNTAYASIGPQTTESAVEHGLTISIEPEQHDIPGLVEGIVLHVGA